LEEFDDEEELHSTSSVYPEVLELYQNFRGALEGLREGENRTMSEIFVLHKLSASRGADPTALCGAGHMMS
jgi:uncharacterized protein (DUF1810 family)